MIGGKIPNLVLNRMLEIFLKIPPLKEILKFILKILKLELIQKRKLQTRK